MKENSFKVQSDFTQAAENAAVWLNMLWMILFLLAASVSGFLVFGNVVANALMHVIFLISVLGFLFSLVWRLNREVNQSDSGVNRDRQRR